MLKQNMILGHPRSLVQHYFADPNPGPQGYGTVAARGGVASRVAGTGPATSSPDDVGNRVCYAADPTTAVPIGLMTVDVIKVDPKWQTLNPYKRGYEEYVEGKVPLYKEPLVWTDMVPTGVASITPDAPAYLAAYGMVSPVQATSGTNGANKAPQVGTFRSGFDRDRFVQVEFAI